MKTKIWENISTVTIKILQSELQPSLSDEVTEANVTFV